MALHNITVQFWKVKQVFSISIPIATEKVVNMIAYFYWSVMLFLPLLRRFNPSEPVVEKSVIL